MIKYHINSIDRNSNCIPFFLDLSLDPTRSLQLCNLFRFYIMMHEMNSLICGHVTRPSPFIFVTKQKLKTVIFCTSLSPSYTILLSSVSHLDIFLPILPKHSFAAISSSAVKKTHRFTQSWAQIITAVILVLDEVRLRNRSSVETSLVFWPPW